MSLVPYSQKSHRDRPGRTHTYRALAPVAKQLSEMWWCGTLMFHHCHLPITCIPSPPSLPAPPPHPSAFLDTGLWQGHIHSLAIHHLLGGLCGGVLRRGEAVMSQTPSQIGIVPDFCLSLSPFFCIRILIFFLQRQLKLLFLFSLFISLWGLPVFPVNIQTKTSCSVRWS